METEKLKPIFELIDIHDKTPGRAADAGCLRILLLEIQERDKQIAELKRDAERYRWLVGNVDRAVPDTLGRHIIYVPPLISEHAEIDAAIDAALSQKSQTERI